MSLTNPNKVVTEERLSEFYQGIYPYLGGMPEMLANKFSKGDLYSMEETMVGQWVDGKPIYKKTFYIDSLPNMDRLVIPHGLPIDKTIKYDAMFKNFLTIPYIGSPHLVPNVTDIAGLKLILSDFVAVNVNRTEIVIMPGKDRSDVDGYVTPYYTKTTDSAIAIGNDTDYSTEEKIIGTWIDGKPLYQKTFIIEPSQMPQVVTEETCISSTIDIGFTNNEKVIDITGVRLKPDSYNRRTLPVWDNSVGNGIIILNAYINSSNMLCIDSKSTKNNDASLIITLKYTKTSD